MQLDQLRELYKLSSYLKDGIDPISKQAFPDDTILNTESIRKYNAEVNLIIGTLISAYVSKGTIGKPDEVPFFLTEEQLRDFPYSDEPVSISKICYEMNTCRLPRMMKLQASVITKGLCKLDLLKEEEFEYGTYKIPTDKGIELGITHVEKLNGYGNSYQVNLYDVKAQRYVVENILTIMKKTFEES